MPTSMRPLVSLRGALAGSALLLISAAPAHARAASPDRGGGTLGAVFFDAGVFIKLLVSGLLLAAVAAVALGFLNGARIRKRSDTPPIGMGFLAGLRAGGPLLALAGASWNILTWHLGMIGGGAVPPYLVLAPGVAEVFLILLAGLLASAAAVFSHARLTAEGRSRPALSAGRETAVEAAR